MGILVQASAPCGPGVVSVAAALSLQPLHVATETDPLQVAPHVLHPGVAALEVVACGGLVREGEEEEGREREEGENCPFILRRYISVIFHPMT